MNYTKILTILIHHRTVDLEREIILSRRKVADKLMLAA